MIDLFIDLLSIIIKVLYIAIISQVIISWIIVAGVRNNLMQNLYEISTTITNPILKPIRNIMPSLGGWDLSPLIAIILLRFIETLLRSNA
tara:strand:- start:2757 stop:3026 length:270 start_codon:yes stop_codon:yes gene_type:complete